MTLLWRRKGFVNPPVIKHMMDSFFNRCSEAGCMESIEAALEAANESDKAYTRIIG